MINRITALRVERSETWCFPLISEGFSAAPPQMIAVLVDKMIRTQIVDCAAVANWLFSQDMAHEFTRCVRDRGQRGVPQVNSDSTSPQNTCRYAPPPRPDSSSGRSCTPPSARWTSTCRRSSRSWKEPKTSWRNSSTRG